MNNTEEGKQNEHCRPMGRGMNEGEVGMEQEGSGRGKTEEDSTLETTELKRGSSLGQGRNLGQRKLPRLYEDVLAKTPSSRRYGP